MRNAVKILSTAQTRAADAFTIANEPIASLDLMERAARAFVRKFSELFPVETKVNVIAGQGNNGGDGLAIARMLHQRGHDVLVQIVQHSANPTTDFLANRQRLNGQLDANEITHAEALQLPEAVVIDAMLGSGLTRPLSGLLAEVVQKINGASATVVAVDSPTGLFTEQPNAAADVILKATHTITFETPKLAFLLPQSDEFVGNWRVVDIGLSPEFMAEITTDYFYVTPSAIEIITKKRARHSHKGTFGSGLLRAGNYGMMGAAVLAAKAAMRSGIGKLTVLSDETGNTILQTAVPEAMFMALDDKKQPAITAIIPNYQAIGWGPGIGVNHVERERLKTLFSVCETTQTPLVLDADALNNLAEDRKILNALPENTILTPHPKEMYRLLGEGWTDDFDRLIKVRDFAAKYRVIVVLKGANTAIVLPDGQVFFNSTGNPGMATAGSGDVLTGMILAFLGQGYAPADAAVLGVFEHGRAGDRAVAFRSERSVIASDIIENIR